MHLTKLHRHISSTYEIQIDRSEGTVAASALLAALPRKAKSASYENDPSSNLRPRTHGMTCVLVRGEV